MAKRDSFLLRIDPKVLDAIRQWADDDMRSVNGQIEYLLRQSARRAGRINTKVDKTSPDESQEGSDST